MAVVFSTKWQVRLKAVLLPGLMALLLLYTADQLLTGERGIVTWRVMKSQLADLRAENARLQDDIDHLNVRITLMKGPASGKNKGVPNRDFLDELARKELGLVKPGEQVILDGELK
jgi:cell division protein FtsB